MTHLKRECGFLHQLLNLPVTFFQQIEELDEIEDILATFIGDTGLRARITDYNYGGVTGDGNSFRVVFCCRHGNSTGLGVTMEKRDRQWHITEEWNDTYRFCPSCEGYEKTYVPFSCTADQGAFSHSLQPSLCMKTENI